MLTIYVVSDATGDTAQRMMQAALVQFQPVFDEAAKRAPADYWVWDNVHPTYRGHQLMADEWERVVREFWKPASP